MGSKTKIVVLHMKEVIYTVIFAALGILLLFLLLFMFRPNRSDPSNTAEKKYTPGIYTAVMTLNDTNLEVEVTVDEFKIQSIRFSNLDETVTTMFPLVQPALEEIADQIYDSQSLDHIALSDETPYTSQVILNTITEAVEKAAAQ